mmetsp:Transcript_3018/g.8470  ORF Transcript_3018/g.8470 Transcript_3018/m.8470 type:complete len:308 (+) Transcript_3018:131-1054(+)
MLAVVATALARNRVPYLRCKGGRGISKGLRQFRADPSFVALLLLFKNGANGLNVTEATHVLLCEPTLDAAAEAQAVGRVHRIGQTRPTTVHRFVVQDTVEERVLALALRKVAVLRSSLGLVGSAASGASEDLAGIGGRAPDPITLEDLQDLFPELSNSSPDERAALGVGSGAGDTEQGEESQEDAEWWQGLVLHQGQEVTRERATTRIQCASAASSRMSDATHLSTEQVLQAGTPIAVTEMGHITAGDNTDLSTRSGTATHQSGYVLLRGRRLNRAVAEVLVGLPERPAPTSQSSDAFHDGKAGSLE